MFGGDPGWQSGIVDSDSMLNSFRMHVLPILCGICVLTIPLGFAYAQIMPLVPPPPASGHGYRACDLMILANNIVKFLLMMSVFVAALLIAIQGFHSVIGGEGGELKSTITNIVIGILIMLTGWLVVDTILRKLTGDRIGPWNAITCVENTEMRSASFVNTSGVQQGSQRGPAGARGSGAQCDPANPACSVGSLVNAGFNQTQAAIMSCIAMTESSGNPDARSNQSTACGTFQVIRSTWNAAATGECANFSNCTNAACNAQVAQTLVSRNGYRDWTCANCNSRAQGCINQYGGTSI